MVTSKPGEHAPTEPAAVRLRDARAAYFAKNGFGVDGGYGDAWVHFKLGPVPFPFPNTKGRVRAVQYHDLHHVVTGYATDLAGELEIAAWELGAGCGRFWAAWQLNLGALGAGAVLHPMRTWRAFVHGRRSRSLYGLDLAALLEGTVEEARERTRSSSTGPGAATALDGVLFGLSAAAGLIMASATFGLALPLVPVGLLTFALRRRERVAAT